MRLQLLGDANDPLVFRMAVDPLDPHHARLLHRVAHDDAFTTLALAHGLPFRFLLGRGLRRLRRLPGGLGGLRLRRLRGDRLWLPRRLRRRRGLLGRRRSDDEGGASLAAGGVGPRQIPPRDPEPGRVLGDPHRQLEPEIEDLLGQLAGLLRELVLGEIAPLRRLHRSVLTGSASGSRTSWRCRSCWPPSGTPRAPRPPARPPSHTGCDPASPRPPTPRDCPCPCPCASRPASWSPACRETHGSTPCRRASSCE